MANRSYSAGTWYESKADVRTFYGEYRKGILIRKTRIGIIFNYLGARRSHYGDRFGLDAMEITYIGEGKSGDQTYNARNCALIDAIDSKAPVDVFFDCGDVFKPKRLVSAGRWRVSKHAYRKDARQERSLFRFTLEPVERETEDVLRLMFGTLGADHRFERALAPFAAARAALYANHPHVLRARDSIAGEIGEYFAVKIFNERNKSKPLMRLRTSFRHVDAIQVDTGMRYAIKTISRFGSMTSNIWSKNVVDDVDAFLIVVLSPTTLRPERLLEISADDAERGGFIRFDAYQKSRKLKVDAAFALACVDYGKCG